MDDWDHIPAPQWSDFQSPMCVETYFDTRQDETLTELINDHQDETITSEKTPLSMLSTNEIDFISEIDKVKMTPIRIVSPNKRNKENSVKEITYEDFLSKAISDIRLTSARRSNRKSIKNTPTKSDASSENYYTPNEKYLTPAVMTQSLVKLLKPKTSSAKNLENDFQEVDKKEILKAENNCNENEVKNTTINESKQDIAKNLTEDLNNFIPSKLITNKFTLKDSKVISGKSKTQKVLPYQNRRLSIKKLKKPEMKASKPFVSMAEAVTKFQVETPKRFRSTNFKVDKPNLASKFATKQLTHAVSPALRSKTRVRPTTALSQVQKEELEMEKNKANPIKANPIRMPKKPNVLKKIEKKPPTMPEPFKLTCTKKENIDNKDDQSGKAEALPVKKPTSVGLGRLKKSNSMTLVDVVKKQDEFKKQCLSRPDVKKVSPDKIRRPKSHGYRQSGIANTVKNTVPVVVGTDGKAITVQDKEVIHFGIRLNQTKVAKTKAAPFSFDRRAKEFQEKKQQKLKQLQEEELKKQKIDFHAKPLPTFKRSNSTPQLNSKEHSAIKIRTTPQPFSFEQRDRMLMKKKEELQKQAQDIDKKSRLFHANPAPNFKFAPISVTNFKIDRKREPVLNKNRPLKAVQLPNCQKEDKASSKLTKSTAKDKEKPKFKKIIPKVMELHSDKRARERKEFDEKLKAKQQTEQELKQKAVEDRIIEQKEADTILRKQMEVKARPMPEFKPVSVIKSSKPLTNPQSPGWIRPKND